MSESDEIDEIILKEAEAKVEIEDEENKETEIVVEDEKARDENGKVWNVKRYTIE